MRGLIWDDVDFKNRVIQIRRNVTYDSSTNKFITGELKTKSGYRDIPMTQIAYDILMDIKNQQLKPRGEILSFEFADHIFLNSNGNLTS